MRLPSICISVVTSTPCCWPQSASARRASRSNAPPHDMPAILAATMLRSLRSSSARCTSAGNAGFVVATAVDSGFVAAVICNAPVVRRARMPRDRRRQWCASLLPSWACSRATASAPTVARDLYWLARHDRTMCRDNRSDHRTLCSSCRTRVRTRRGSFDAAEYLVETCGAEPDEESQKIGARFDLCGTCARAEVGHPALAGVRVRVSKLPLGAHCRFEVGDLGLRFPYVDVDLVVRDVRPLGQHLARDRIGVLGRLRRDRVVERGDLCGAGWLAHSPPMSAAASTVFRISLRGISSVNAPTCRASAFLISGA